VTVPAFTAGTTAPVVVTATKVNQALSSQVALEVRDVAGNRTTCDPVVALSVRVSGRPQEQVFGGLAQSENRVTILNGSPGVRNLQISVNGQRFRLTGLRDNAQTTLDVSKAMRSGSSNTVTVTADGKPGASATVVISD
jgi:hypothetical protein